MSEIDTDEARTRIEGWFPKIADAGYKITSEQDQKYNCISWAGGDKELWWEAIDGVGYFWPKGIAENDLQETLVKVYEAIGYEVCKDGEIEDGFEKLALYCDGKGAYTHAARQLKDGRWASKLGPFEDIEHQTCNCICGDFPSYGQLFCYMKREVKDAETATEQTRTAEQGE